MPHRLWGCPPALPLEQWTVWTWAEHLADVETVARGLIALGFEENDTVNVWGYNSPEWIISASASQFAGGKVAGILLESAGVRASGPAWGRRSAAAARGSPA